jgi:superfamily II DNA or RNA helicase
MMFPAAIRLGLSATTDRSDGKWIMIEAHIGKVMVRGTTVPMKPKVLVKLTGWRIPTVTRWVDDPSTGHKMKKQVPLPHAPGRMMGVITAMAEDHARNQLIVDFVVAAHRAGRTTVIMSELVDKHLKPMFHLLAKHIPAVDIDYYIGGRTKAQLEIAKTKTVVLATYQMCGEGTDVPHWDTLVLATPRANIKQGIGRIMRILEGKREPVCLDLVDADSIFRNFYLSREKQYFQVQAKIVKM